MIWQKYELDEEVLKATEDMKLWQTEKGIIEISSSTLGTAIKLDNRRKGYVFHGHGKLLLDAIVETEEGAIGKSIEKELNESFLMLGDIEEIQQHLTKASKEDLSKMGYENQQGFIARAEDLCDQFFKKRVHYDKRFNGDYGLIFAFLNEAGKLDILVAKGSKLVYKAMDMLFVSNEGKVVLKSQGEVVCKKNGKSVIINQDESVIIKK